MVRLFDLNIEQVLEHWGLEHALREIIANAIDEQVLTKTADIKIYIGEKCRWHIRDYGRGLQYIHFTQKENADKLQSPNLIGKFGVGLKDALAVFNRHNITVEIFSKHATVSLQMANKASFDIETLHAVFNEPRDTTFVGTEFIITGVTQEDIEKAKSMFLRFSGSTLLEKNRYGEVYNRCNDSAHVYVNGVQVAKEENFMFSYNVTNITTQIKKALNRERSNVGRTAYSDSVKKILTQCTSKTVLLELVKDLDNIMRGTNKDETLWLDVSTYAAKTLNKQGDVVFITPNERANLTNEQVEILEQSGKQVVLITDSLKEKLGSAVTTFTNIMHDYTTSFEYKFVDYAQLSAIEKSVFDTKANAIEFLKRHNCKHSVPIRVSETIRINEYGEMTDGVWDGKQIIIKRSALTSERFLAVLLHEFAHYLSGATDNTREFENQLTKIIGYAITELIHNTKNM
ncbi:MAG: ATP-binding protein [Nitrososphaerota archaeon]|jgi:hypothetical protein|nr:ATP-binding protein [Nitrososphaerota archaeon]